MFKILFFSIVLFFHPVHVSMTSIDYNPESDSYKVFVRMYFDDFLRDCKLCGIDVMEKDFSAGNSSSRAALEKYIGEKIVIKVNSDKLTGKLLDMNLSENEISMNLECHSGKRPKTIVVKNLIMTELHNDQLNMVIMKVNYFEEGIKLTSEMTERTFKIK